MMDQVQSGEFRQRHRALLVFNLNKFMKEEANKYFPPSLLRKDEVVAEIMSYLTYFTGEGEFCWNPPDAEACISLGFGVFLGSVDPQKEFEAMDEGHFDDHDFDDYDWG